MTAAAWYSAVDHLPPLGARVMLRWAARPEIEGALVVDPRRKRRLRPGEIRRYLDGRTVCWAVNVAGGRLRESGVASDQERLLLPAEVSPPDPRAPWVGWHTLSAWPDFWRPLDAARWVAPLPPVAWLDDGTDRPGRLWSATTSYRAVEDAEAQHVPGAGAKEKRWWTDPFSITYSPPGSITFREAEGRLMRAFNAEHWVRLEHPDMGTFSESLERMAKRLAAERGADNPLPMRPEPTGRDRDDMLIALGWLKGLPRVWWKASGAVHLGNGRILKFQRNVGAIGDPLLYGEELLRLRERDPPMSWRQIGKRVGLSHERARRLYGEALDIITATANGEVTAGAADIAERLAAVQASNRAWRRGERD